MKKLLLTAITAITLISCASSGVMNKISNGMSKQEVIKKMGKPSSTSSDGYYEYLRYELTANSTDAFYGNHTTYYVRLLDGKVDSYGKMGDFDSSKNPTIDVNTNNKYQNMNENSSDKMYSELNKLKDLLDRGIITKDEYEAKKQEILKKY